MGSALDEIRAAGRSRWEVRWMYAGVVNADPRHASSVACPLAVGEHSTARQVLRIPNTAVLVADALLGDLERPGGEAEHSRE